MATCFRQLGVWKDHIEAASHIILLWCICPTELGPIKTMIKFQFYPATSRSKDHSMDRIIVCVDLFWILTDVLFLWFTLYISTYSAYEICSKPTNLYFCSFLVGFWGSSQSCSIVCSRLQCHIDAQMLFQLFCFHSVSCQITGTRCTSLAFSMRERRKMPETAQWERAQNSMSTINVETRQSHQIESVGPAENCLNESIFMSIVSEARV